MFTGIDPETAGRLSEIERRDGGPSPAELRWLIATVRRQARHIAAMRRAAVERVAIDDGYRAGRIGHG